MWQYITFYTIRDLLRNRWFFLYSGFLLILTVGFFQLQGTSAKVSVGLLSTGIYLIPLLSSLFGVMYFYNSREFIELMLTQPIRRSVVYGGMLIGLGIALTIGYLIGLVVPHIAYGATSSESLRSLLYLAAIGTVLAIIYLSISFYIAIRFDDRGKGLAATLGFWLLSALIYDGLILAGTMVFSDYPLEYPLLFASLLNPIDLARVILLIETDWAALMGYTGAVFRQVFGTPVGILCGVSGLFLWIFAPLWFGSRLFAKKDF